MCGIATVDEPSAKLAEEVLQQLRQAVTETLDGYVRRRLVEQVKRRYEQGEYEIDAVEIARSIIEQLGGGGEEPSQ